MSFTTFTPLLWLLLLVVAGWGYARSLVDRPQGLKLASFLLRIAGIVLLVLALCRPFASHESDEVHLVFLVDVSQSVDLKAAQKVLDEIDESLKNLRSGDGATVYAMAKGLHEKSSANFRKMLEDWSKGVADDAFRAHSLIADSMLAARLSFPAGKGRRMVVISDGVETGGGIAEALDQLRGEGVDVRFRPLAALQEPEASMVSLEAAAPFAFRGEVLRLTARVTSNAAMKARVRLLNKGVAVKESAVTLKPGEELRVPFDQEMSTPGPSVWSAEIIPDKDHFPINNTAMATVQVRGEPRVLILHEDEKKMRHFARALKEQNFDVDLRGKRGLPENMQDLLAFDCIILANLSATDMTPRQMNLLRSYVADFGGGLAMFGSDNSFGLGGYYKTPVEEVLPLVSRFEKEKEKPSLAMVLVIDKSGSMEGTPIDLARQAAKSAAELLGPQDQIAVIGFDGGPQVVCEMTSASQQGTIQAAIDSLAAGGGTYMFPAMEAGKEMLERTTAKVKHMICLTDGQTQDADHIGLTQQMVDAGITVSTVGLGEGSARELLQQIAETGRGRYYESNDPASLPQIFTKETTQASKSAVQEGLFQPIAITEHPMMSGYDADALPVSLGFVMTEAKPAVQVLLGAETGDPLLAVGRFGLGIGLAWTSDLTEAWGGEWLAWDGCGKFWAQVLRGTVRKTDVEGMTTRGEIKDGAWTLRIDRRDEAGAPLSGITFTAQALDENGTTQDLAVAETGLGRYEAHINLAGRQHIAVRLHDRNADKLDVKHYHAPYPEEYRLGAKPAEALAARPNFQPAAIREALPLAHRLESIAHWFVWGALGCLLSGVLLRRL